MFGFILPGCCFEVWSSPDGFCVESIQGMLFNPLSGSWSWAESTALNYALCAVKGREGQLPGPAHTPEQQLAHDGAAVDQERREN